MAAEVQVRVEGLVKKYGEVEAVRGVSFDLHKGEVFGLLGPNGAGKTSTIEMTEGLRQPDAGTVTICGFDPFRSPIEVKQRIGAQLQEMALPEKMKVREAMTLFAGYYQNPESSAKLLDRFTLAEKANATYDNLSGGQKQRLALALALINKPEVVFLDEPTAGLDAQVRHELHQIIQELRAEGRTLLLTTHYIEEAEKLCDRVAIVDHGRIVAMDTPRALVAQSKQSSRIEFSASRDLPESALAKLDQVTKVEAKENGTRLLRTSNSTATLVSLVRLLEKERADLVDLHISRPSLEDLFLELTGTRIRE